MKIYLLLIVTLILLATAYRLPPTTSLAQTTSTCPSGQTPIRVTGGTLSLFTVGSDTNLAKYSADGKCIVGTRANIPQFGIPSFDELKSLFYTQAPPSPSVNKHPALAGNQDQSVLSGNNSQDHLFLINGDLNISGNIPGSDIALVFIEGNLNIKSNLTQPAPKKGLIFIARGNINIDPSVRTIDAVLINYNIFCSAYDFGAGQCPPTNIPAQQLVINGSVIYLNSTARATPNFVRDNGGTGNSQPAEVINYDPKYLVVLKNLMTRNLTIWKEVQ